MEKTRTKKQKFDSIENNNIEQSIIEERKPKLNIWGWNNVNEVANDVWNSIHYNLLSGNLIFAIKNTGGLSNSDLIQLVITQNINNMADFSVGVFTTGYSMLLPHVPASYLKTDLFAYMKDWKIKSDILKTYEILIKNY